MDTPPNPPPTPWHPPLLWRVLLVVARGLVALFCRLRVTGDIPERLRRGPLILAANHISPMDPVILTAACRVRRIAPRIMATGGLFRAPVVGAAMRTCGHIRVDRREANVAESLTHAAQAIAGGSVLLVYPEGRIGIDPGMWPERGKTGAARLAFASGAPVAAVAQWGAHELVPYAAPKGMARALLRSVLRRPIVRVHFGPVVELADLRTDGDAGPAPAPLGQARRGTERIIDAITETLRPLRPDEPDGPAHLDPTRPVDTARSHRPRA